MHPNQRGYFSPRLYYSNEENNYEPSNPTPEVIFSAPVQYEPTDLVFIVQNKRFHAHKAIVGSRSTFFNHLIQQLKQFKQNGSLEVEIEIPDCSANIFAKILSFIYTSTIQLFEDEVWLIYDTAQTYRLADLQQKCEEFIQQLINEDNVFDIIKITNKIPNSEFVVQACKLFLKERVATTNTSSPAHQFFQNRGPLSFSTPQMNVNHNPFSSAGVRNSSFNDIHTPQMSQALNNSVGVEGGTGKLVVPPLHLENLNENGRPSTAPLSDGKSAYTTAERLQWSLRSLQSLLSLVKTLVMADRITLFFYNQETDQLCSVVRSHSGSNNNVVEEYEIRIPCDLGIAGAVFVSGENVNSQDVYSDPRFFSNIDIQTGYRTKTLLCLPIILKKRNQVSGVIQVLNKLRNNLWGASPQTLNSSNYQKNALGSRDTMEAHFTEEDEKLLTLVCDLVAAVHERIIPESIQSRSINPTESTPTDTPQTTVKTSSPVHPSPAENTPRKKISWQNFKKRRRDSIPIFHFKLPSKD